MRELEGRMRHVDRTGVRESLRLDFLKATNHQQLSMLATQKAALEICEDWMNLVLVRNPKMFNETMREFMLRLSDVIESTPMDYGR